MHWLFLNKSCLFSFSKVMLKTFLIFLHCLINLTCFPSTQLKFIQECYTPLLPESTHLLNLMQTMHSFRCNLCLLYLLLYCELYASTLLRYFSMQIHLSLCLYTSTILVLYCELHACNVLNYSFSTPLHCYTPSPAPLCLYSSSPLCL